MGKISNWLVSTFITPLDKKERNVFEQILFIFFHFEKIRLQLT